MTIIANLIVCALVLMALAALWILSRVFISWVKSNQSDDCPPVMHSRHSKDAKDMLKIYRTAKGYGSGDLTAFEVLEEHLKEAGLHEECTQCQGDPDGCMNCR